MPPRSAAKGKAPLVLRGGDEEGNEAAAAVADGLLAALEVGDGGGAGSRVVMK